MSRPNAYVQSLTPFFPPLSSPAVKEQGESADRLLSFVRYQSEDCAYCLSSNRSKRRQPIVRCSDCPWTPAFSFPIIKASTSGEVKNKTKLLRKLGFLANILDADEKIVFVAPGCSPYTMLERATIGAVWLILIKRALFVFTNKRLLHVPTTWKFDYRGSISQILYQDCRRLHVKSGKLIAEYHNGRTEKFSYIPACDRDVIKHFQFATSESDRRSENPQRHHLCPNCTGVLPSRAVACPSCGLEFKSREKAWTRSVLLPGGGYFYTGHPFIGIGDALGESYLLILTLVSLVLALLGDGEAMLTFLLFLAALTMELRHHLPFEQLPGRIHSDGIKALLSGRQVQTVQTELPPAR